MEATATGGSPYVGLSLEGPRPVRRGTVAFRIILAMPHLVYVFLLWIVAFFAAMAAWVAALVLGRMPEGLGDFLGRVLQYSVRVYGYMYLLTDRYPPFSLADAQYPVTVLLPPRGRLNRAAVLFRLILAVPAGIVVALVSSGLQLALLVIWLIVLLAGRMPTPVFEAEAAFLRYQTRMYAWLLMLTSEYPGGLFGDDRSGPDPGSRRAEVLGPDVVPAITTAQAPTAAPRITRIVLSKAGKRLLAVFLVLGIVLSSGNVAVAIVTGGQNSRAVRHLDSQYETVVTSSQEYGAAVQACGLSGGADCIHAADRELADALRQFRTDLGNEKFPGHALSSAEQLRDDATELIGILDQMAATSDPDTYRTLALQFQQNATQLDEDYLDLHDLLAFGY